MLLEALPQGLPIIHVGDSQTEQQRIQTIRDGYPRTFWQRLRTIQGSCSKLLVRQAQLALAQFAKPLPVPWTTAKADLYRKRHTAVLGSSGI